MFPRRDHRGLQLTLEPDRLSANLDERRRKGPIWPTSANSGCYERDWNRRLPSLCTVYLLRAQGFPRWLLVRGWLRSRHCGGSDRWEGWQFGYRDLVRLGGMYSESAQEKFGCRRSGFPPGLMAVQHHPHGTDGSADHE